MEWPQALAYWEKVQKARGRSPETIRTWRSYLRRFGRFCDPMTATHRDVHAWFADNAWSPSCQKSARSALRSFYALMVREGEIRRKRDPMRRVECGAKQVYSIQPVAGDTHVDRGLRISDEDTALMVWMLAKCNVRVSELAAMHTDDLTDDHGVIVRHGKGGKQRWIPVPCDALWQTMRRRPDGWLFPGRFEGHMHSATIRRKVRRATGMPPHAFRRRYATRVYDGSGDLLALQELLGHSSPATTQIYVRMSRERLRRAAEAA